MKIGPVILQSYYALVLINVFRTKGTESLSYLCMHNWFLLLVYNFNLSIYGDGLLENRLAHFSVSTMFGSCFTMSYIVVKYWPDAWENPEHFLAHYLPLIFCFF